MIEPKGTKAFAILLLYFNAPGILNIHKIISFEKSFLLGTEFVSGIRDKCVTEFPLQHPHAVGTTRVPCLLWQSPHHMHSRAGPTPLDMTSTVKHTL